MGKLKRARQKYHIACVNGRIQNDDTKSEVSWKSTGSEKWNIEPNDDLFKNIKIDIDTLNKLDVVEDDRKSVKSISKTIKQSIKEAQSDMKLSVKAKRKLRRQFFLQKVEAIHKAIEISKNNKKKQKEPSLQDLKTLPQENMLFYKSVGKKNEKPVPKSRHILKAKDRKKNLLNDVEAFKNMILDSKKSGDAISDIILKRIMAEEL